MVKEKIKNKKVLKLNNNNYSKKALAHYILEVKMDKLVDAQKE